MKPPLSSSSSVKAFCPETIVEAAEPPARLPASFAMASRIVCSAAVTVASPAWRPSAVPMPAFSAATTVRDADLLTTFEAIAPATSSPSLPPKPPSTPPSTSPRKLARVYSSP